MQATNLAKRHFPLVPISFTVPVSLLFFFASCEEGVENLCCMVSYVVCMCEAPYFLESCIFLWIDKQWRIGT